MPQDIVITPNRGSTTSGAQIAFTGYSGASSIYLKVLPDSSLSFEGSAGQLFSITDNLSSGTIFSVNDITGIPSFDVNANGLVRIAPYAGNTAVGGTYASGRLHVSTGSQSNKGVIIQGASGQASNYLETQNISGLLGAYINSSMNFTRPVSGQTYSEQFGAAASAAAYGGTAFGYSAAANYVAATAVGLDANAGNQYVTAVGFQANSTQIAGTALGWSATAGQNGIAIGRSANGSAGGIAIGYSCATSTYGDIVFNAAGDGTSGPTNLQIWAGTATTNSFYKQHNIYGTWISNAVATRQGRVQYYVADYGGDREALRYESNLSYALTSIGGSAVLSGQSLAVTAPAASYTPLTLRGATSQTANLQAWQNSAGSTIAYINASGSFGGSLMSGTITSGSIGENAILATNIASGAIGIAGLSGQLQFNTGGSLGASDVLSLNGSLFTVRQTGGTAGTDEIQLSHDGTKGTIRSIDGDLQLGGSNSSVNIRNSANNGNGNLSCNWLYTNGFGSANIINSEGRTVDSYSWTIDSQTFNWNQSFHIRVGWAHIRGYGHAGGIRYAGNNTIGQYASLQITNGLSSPTGGCLSYMSSTTTISSTANDFRPTYYSAFQRLNPTNNYDITGINSYPTIVNSGGGICGWSHADGKVMWLHNVSTNYSLTLKHQTGSLSENQFYCDTGADIVLGPNKMLQLTYDGTISKWRVNTTSMPYNLPASDGPNGSVLQTNGSGTISWTTSPIASGGLQNYMVASGAIYGNALASGAVSTYNLNATNLASGKFLALNGSQLSWQAISTVTGSGAINISNDTTTNDVRYPLFTNATTGTLATGYVSSTKLSFNPSTGDLTVGGNVTANSDERIKANISTIESAVEKVNQLRGVYFERKDSGIKNIGVIAQEVEKVIPEVVRESDGIKSVAYGNIVALLIEAIKEQDKKIKLLEEKLCQ